MWHGTRRRNKPLFLTSCFWSWCFVIAKEALINFRTYKLFSGNQNASSRWSPRWVQACCNPVLPVLAVSAQHAPCTSLGQHFSLWKPAQQDRNHVYSPGWFSFEESSRFLTHLKQGLIQECKISSSQSTYPCSPTGGVVFPMIGCISTLSLCILLWRVTFALLSIWSPSSSLTSNRLHYLFYITQSKMIYFTYLFGYNYIFLRVQCKFTDVKTDLLYSPLHAELSFAWVINTGNHCKHFLQFWGSVK